MVLAPGAGPRVSSVEAMPALFVGTDNALSEAPPEVTANVTVTPPTGLPLASVTLTVNGLGNVWPTVPAFPLPLTRVRFAGPLGALVAVAVNVIGLPVSEPELAVTAFDPAAGPSVRTVEAKPLPLVVTDVALSAPPPPATVNVTPIPETGFPLASVTSTVKGLPRACPEVPVWPLPLIDRSLDAVPVPPPPPPPPVRTAFKLKQEAVNPL